MNQSVTEVLGRPDNKKDSARTSILGAGVSLSII